MASTIYLDSISNTQINNENKIMVEYNKSKTRPKKKYSIIEYKTYLSTQELYNKNGFSTSGPFISDLIHYKIDASYMVNTVVFSHNKRYIIVLYRNGLIRVYKCNNGALISTINIENQQIYTMIASPNYPLIISGGFKNIIQFHNQFNGNLKQQLNGHSSTVISLAANANFLVSYGGDGEIKVWEINKRKLIKTIKISRSRELESIAIYSNYVIGVGRGNSVAVWNFLTGKNLYTIPNELSGLGLFPTQAIAVNSHYIVYGVCLREINIIYIRRLIDGSIVHTINAHNQWITSVKLISNYIISGSHDHTIKIWQFSDSKFKHIKTLYGHEFRIFSLDVSNNFIISGSHDKTVRMWPFSRPCRNRILNWAVCTSRLKKH